MLARLIFTALIFTAALSATDLKAFDEAGPTLRVQNRVLCRIGDNAISAMDVVKKMDAVFTREFQEYTENPEARYQFYSNNWRYFLSEIIDRELILADANAHEIEVSAGDVREEIEGIFGPNVMANLDQINMSYDEAWKQIRDDIKVRRVLMGRVNSKAMMSVGPKAIKDAYQQFSQEQAKARHWVYRVISVRGGVDPAGLALSLREALADEQIQIEDIPNYVSAVEEFKDSNVNVSEELERDQNTVSSQHKEALEDLETGSYSKVLEQDSRGRQKVYRIFYAQKADTGQCPAFNAISRHLKENLIQREMAKGTQIYVNSLRKEYGIDEEWLVGLEADAPPLFQLKL